MRMHTIVAGEVEHLGSVLGGLGCGEQDEPQHNVHLAASISSILDTCAANQVHIGAADLKQDPGDLGQREPQTSACPMTGVLVEVPPVAECPAREDR